MRLGLRILLIPVIAGIAYELIRFAGSFNNAFAKIVSIPGLLLQKITTKEPDEKMVEVAIAAIEAVFDWRDFEKDNFGQSEEETVEVVVDDANSGEQDA